MENNYNYNYNYKNIYLNYLYNLFPASHKYKKYEYVFTNVLENDKLDDYNKKYIDYETDYHIDNIIYNKNNLNDDLGKLSNEYRDQKTNANRHHKEHFSMSKPLHSRQKKNYYLIMVIVIIILIMLLIFAAIYDMNAPYMCLYK